MSTATTSHGLAVRRVTDGVAWDDALVRLPGAHALQTWEWGEAKRAVGEQVERVWVSSDDKPIVLAQIFAKTVSPLKLRTAWIPRGPVVDRAAPNLPQAVTLLKRFLSGAGYRLLIAKPYCAIGERVGWNLPRKRELTFVFDLSQPLSSLEANLDRGWRHGRNKFFRHGGTVVEDREPEAIEPIIHMYASLGARKSFRPYGDAALSRAMWNSFRQARTASVSAHLLRAEIDGRWAGGILVIRVGTAAYPLRFGFDYELRHTRVSEGVFWAAMQRMAELGVGHLDLEGVDPKNNPGVFEFKRKMGGELIELPRLQAAWLW